MSADLTEPGPQLVCPGCGSRDVNLERLFCGTCAPVIAEEATP